MNWNYSHGNVDIKFGAESCRKTLTLFTSLTCMDEYYSWQLPTLNGEERIHYYIHVFIKFKSTV